MSEGRLMGKTAIVTGAASGIGRASAELFASEGAKVLAVDRSPDVEQLHGDSVIGRVCDVTDEAQVAETVAAALAEFGGLDIMFNNAGIEGTPAPLAESSSDEFDQVIAVNLKGVYYGIKHALGVMLRAGGGSIVSTSSIAGLVGFQNSGAYCASKGAVDQLTRAAALECAGSGIRVNAICPGVIRTPMIDRFVAGNPQGEAQLAAGEPVGHIGEPVDIAQAALYLASDASKFVTGSLLVVDGGWTAQ